MEQMPAPEMGGEQQMPPVDNSNDMEEMPAPEINDDETEEMPAPEMNDGEEANEGDDSKKEIQKLAGKLSELLHTYNEENGDDEELNKYVKGMIDAQTDGSDESEDDESDDDIEDIESNDEPEKDDEMKHDDSENDDEVSNEEEKPKHHKKEHHDEVEEGTVYTKRQIREGLGCMNDELKSSKSEKSKQRIKNTKRKHSPFNPPKFK